MMSIVKELKKADQFKICVDIDLDRRYSINYHDKEKQLTFQKLEPSNVHLY